MLTSPKAVYVRHRGLLEGENGGERSWRQGPAPQGHFASRRTSLLAGEARRAGSGSEGWPPGSLVWLLIQKAGEHGEGSLGHVGGDHVSSALDGEKGDVGELLHEASNLFPTVPVVN